MSKACEAKRTLRIEASRVDGILGVRLNGTFVRHITAISVNAHAEKPLVETTITFGVDVLDLVECVETLDAPAAPASDAPMSEPAQECAGDDLTASGALARAVERITHCLELQVGRGA